MSDPVTETIHKFINSFKPDKKKSCAVIVNKSYEAKQLKAKHCAVHIEKSTTILNSRETKF